VAADMMPGLVDVPAAGRLWKTGSASDGWMMIVRCMMNCGSANDSVCDVFVYECESGVDS
jgi:hypothetical protein